MRPERLEVENFTTFRQPTVVDLSDAELFALTGPTGAGKSSIVDAITFALYGSVPRYADRRLVAPVISQGQVEARVRLDFTVDGVDYTAVRVVRATGRAGGATTKEARLERRRGDEVEVLAGTADELTAQVEALLGLTYEHFTTCVVLPQGEFMRFLHQKPSERQGLLVSLLDLSLFSRLHGRAATRASAATARHETLEQRMEDLSKVASAETRVEIRREIDELEGLLARFDEAQPQLEALSSVAEREAARAATAHAQAELVAGVVASDDLGELAALLSEATGDTAEATQAEEEAGTRLGAAEAALAELGDRATLEQLRADHERLSLLADRLERGTQVVAEARTMAVAAHDAADKAAEAHRAAVEQEDAARRADRAEEFVLALVTGEPCPICGQEVHDPPEHRPGDVAAAQRSVGEAKTALDLARGALESAAAKLASADAQFDELTRQSAELRTRLDGQPTAEEVSALLARVTAAEEARQRSQADYTAARKARVAAEKAQAAAEKRAAAARSGFDAVRDRVAALGPPVPARIDLVSDWDELVAWAAGERPRLQEEAAASAAEAAEARAGADALLAELRRAAEVAGVEAGDRPRDAVMTRLADARADLVSVEQAIEEIATLRVQAEASAEDADVAGTLALHLKSNYFEKWLLDSVLERLTQAATGVLTDLSGGSYSLVLDDKTRNFAVCDHDNADLVRPARTLSGGETFLTSLALALALANQVAELAAGGAARLESIFLDEGFGTLDPDTLQTVADTLEVLRAQGRMVGVITHVPELAEQLPLRFEVRKTPAGSTVERVES